MPNEIKELQDGIQSTIADYKTELDGVKKNREADAQAIEKMAADLIAKNDALTSAENEIAQIKTAMSRPTDTTQGNSEEVEQKATFDTFLRDVKSGKVEMDVVKAMSTDVSPDGGYLVRPQLIDRVMSRVFETSPMRQISTVQQISTKAIEMLIDDQEAAAFWEGEGVSTTSDTKTPQLGVKSWIAHKIAAEPRVTTEMLEDSAIDVEAWLMRKVADKFARTENAAFVLGDGTNKPRGFLTYDAWNAAGAYERNAIEQINLGSSSDVTADGLIELQNSLKQAYQARANFALRRSSLSNIMKLKSTSNYHFLGFQPSDRDTNTMRLTILNQPVTFMDDMPTIAGNALPIAYGDFGEGYLIVDRVGLSILRDPFTSKGGIAYYTTKRVGGDVSNFESIKIGKIAS